MKSRPSLLQRIWRKLRGARPAAPAKAPAPARKVVSTLEPLEGRISPAALINPTTLMYRDFDGDIVTVKFSKALFTSTSSTVNLASANKVFQFNTGTVDTNIFNKANLASLPMQQLRLIDVTQAPVVGGKNAAIGTGITVSVVKAGGGNGQADVGYIRAYEPAGASTAALEVPLGAVSIAGDLGQIDAGGATATIGLASLKVKTLGARLPADTQPPANATTLPSGRSLVSNIVGALGALTVTGDVKDASVLVVAGKGAGNIASVTIGGSLRGGTADQSGLISAAGKIGAVKVGTHLTDGIFGGAGQDSGEVNSDGAMASLTVLGSITGSTGISSGLVRASGGLGAVLVKGSIVGGTMRDSGSISGSNIGAVTIGGSVKSGGDAGAGVISSLRSIGLVKISGDIDGSVNNTVDSIGSGGIQAEGKIAGVTVLGSLKGGSGSAALTGFINSGSDLGPVSVNDITGGSAQNSGSISAGGRLTSVTVKGDVLGGGGNGSGSIFSGVDPSAVGDLGAVKIGGRLVGSGGDNSGAIISGGKILSVTIGTATPAAVVDLQGAAGNFSGSVISNGAMTAVKILGQVEGGGGVFSGSIWSRDEITTSGETAGDLGTVVIAGHLKGGSNTDSGEIRADGKLTSVTVGDVLGAGGVRSGSIRAGQGSLHNGTGAIVIKGDLSFGGGAQSGGVIAEGKIASVLVTGNVAGGTIRAGDNIGTITVNKDVSAGTNAQGAQFSARGQAVQGATTDLAIGRVSILGNVSSTRIRAGYDTTLVNPVNPDAQIGAVYVKGNWTASDLFAGVIDGGAAGFGTPGDVKIPGTDNPKIISQISSIIIGGTVTGGGGVHRGFVAQKIVAMKVGTSAVHLTAGLDSIDLVPNSVTVLEVPV